VLKKGFISSFIC